MNNKNLLLSQEDAFLRDVPLYGEVSEVYGDDLIEGTSVSALNTLSGTVVLSSFIEREHFRTDKGYKQEVSREIESMARFIGHTAQITSF